MRCLSFLQVPWVTMTTSVTAVIRDEHITIVISTTAHNNNSIIIRVATTIETMKPKTARKPQSRAEREARRRRTVRTAPVPGGACLSARPDCVAMGITRDAAVRHAASTTCTIDSDIFRDILNGGGGGRREMFTIVMVEQAVRLPVESAVLSRACVLFQIV